MQHDSTLHNDHVPVLHFKQFFALQSNEHSSWRRYPVISSFARLWSYPKKERWSFYDVIYDESNVVAAQDLGSYRKFGEWVC